MSIDLKAPELRELKPRIMVCGIGGAGGNAVNNMIVSGLIGVDFIVANTDAQALMSSRAERIMQMGMQVTEGLGAGSQPEVGRAAAEEVIEEIRDHLAGAHMCFVTAGMGGGTGTGAAPVIARVARELGILTVGVVTKPFQFEGVRRMRVADAGILELQKSVDTLIVIPNQNLFRIANEKTTFADAFAMADQVLYSGVACITDLMVKEGLINLDFADVRAVMREMGKAMMGTGEATGEKRAILAAEAAIANPLLDEVSMKGARGLLISITGGNDLTLYEVDEAASRIRQEVDEDANIILGATFDQNLDGMVRVSVVATGIDSEDMRAFNPIETRIAEVTERPRIRTEVRTSEILAERRAAAEAPAPRFEEPVTYAEPAPLAQPATTRGVHLQPTRAPAPQYVEPEHAQLPEPEPFDAGPFIPPAAESPVVRAQRMPQIEDLPMPAQKQIRAQHAEPIDTPHRKTLLERLAAFGVSRHDEPPRQVNVPVREPVARIAAPAPRHAQPGNVHAEYGKRPAQSTPRQVQSASDAHQGRAPAPRSIEDDQLEIPAFLRRQSN
ncbi:MAG TPA: cell division protein FtsZ [Methylovirgula sp.]